LCLGLGGEGRGRAPGGGGGGGGRLPRQRQQQQQQKRQRAGAGGRACSRALGARSLEKAAKSTIRVVRCVCCFKCWCGTASPPPVVPALSVCAPRAVDNDTQRKKQKKQNTFYTRPWWVARFRLDGISHFLSFVDTPGHQRKTRTTRMQICMDPPPHPHPIPAVTACCSPLPPSSSRGAVWRRARPRA
jgi:hypothetical protein